MDVANTRRPLWRRVGLAAVAALMVAFAPRRARADDDDRTAKPWLPMVESGAAPDEIYAKYALSTVHLGETAWRVNRGKVREGVSRADFFVTIGRPDLAKLERRRNNQRNGFFWTGVSLAITGGLLMYATVSRGGYDPPPWFGLGTMGAGGICIVISSMIHGPVLTADEVDGVVGRYNELLKMHIEEETGTTKPKPIQARLELLAPFVDGHSGAGLLAVARF